MGSGGAERALLTLLTILDRDKFEIDLILFKKAGLFLEYIPNDIKIIDLSSIESGEKTQKGNSFLKRIFKGSSKYFWKTVRFIFLKLPIDKVWKNQARWNISKHLTPGIKVHYDIAVAFLEITPLYFVVDKIKSDKKLCFVHTDYIKAKLNPNFDRPYFKQVEKIITVSDSAATALKSTFPEMCAKVQVINNITSKSLLMKLAEENIDDFNFIGVKILTVGRLAKEKGFDLVIQALNHLVLDGYNVRWYVIGSGPEFSNIIQEIRQNNLEKYFCLLGEKANPYPYMRLCDIYVQPSRWEGWGIALEEALMLNRPAIATNFPSAYEQIQNESEGIICSMDAHDIYLSVKKMIDYPDVRVTISDTLTKKANGKSEQALESLYCLFE